MGFLLPPNAFSTLMNLLDRLGLPVNFLKVEKPQTKIMCLGIDIDAKNGILTVPDKKMEKKSTMYTMETKNVRNKKPITEIVR